MMTKMFYEGADYDAVLKEARTMDSQNAIRRQMWKEWMHVEKLRFFLRLYLENSGLPGDLYGRDHEDYGSGHALCKEDERGNQTACRNETGRQKDRGDCGAVSSAVRASACKCQRRVQCDFCSRKCAG